MTYSKMRSSTATREMKGEGERREAEGRRDFVHMSGDVEIFYQFAQYG